MAVNEPRLKMLVTGSRDWPDAVVLFETLNEIAHTYRVEVLLATYAPVLVIHGDSGNADKWAEAWAQLEGHERDPHPARWRVNGVYNPNAGRERNVEMYDAHPDLHVVAAFWDGKSTGTKHCMDEGERRGIPIERELLAAVSR